MDKNLFIEKLVTKLAQLGLAGPTLLLLEAHKPLAFIGSQFLLVAQPSLNLFISPFYTQGMIDFLDDPKQMEQCLTRLEQVAEQNSSTVAHRHNSLTKETNP